GGFTDDGGVYDTDWNYPDSRQYVSYTADFGSAKVYVALQNDADENIKGGETHFDGGDAAERGRKFMPDIEAGASATFGDWQVAGGVAYDESAESFAVKKLVAGNFGMFGVRLMGLYANSDENIFFNYDGFSAILGLQAKVTDTVTISKDLQWWDNGDWRVVGDVNWAVASGFSVLLEGTYADRYDVKTKTGMLRFQRDF
uniref:porin n=1 Tax=uncultured Rhizobium sp. TaxID=155567 RepID=UPI002605C053